MTVTTTPGTDVITDVLRSIRLHGTLYFEAQLNAPWGINIADSCFANFHQVTECSFLMAVDCGQCVELG